MTVAFEGQSVLTIHTERIDFPLKINEEYLPAKVLSPCCTPRSFTEVIIFPKYYSKTECVTHRNAYFAFLPL